MRFVSWFDALSRRQLHAPVRIIGGLWSDVRQLVLVHAYYSCADCRSGGLYLCLRIDTSDAGYWQPGGTTDRRHHLRLVPNVSDSLVNIYNYRD